MADAYDLIVIGAGSSGLIAAKFAAALGVRVALVEKSRIGGDCTWTGCVPSKALLKAAKVAHHARSAATYGVKAGPVEADMPAVRAYVGSAIQEVYQREPPAVLQEEGVTVLLGAAKFLDPRTLQVGEQVLKADKILLTIGAHPILPDLPGLAGVRYQTYLTLFDNDRLPNRLLVIGGGPIGLEMAQAYRRLGAQVTVFAERLLAKDEPEARERLRAVLSEEGVQFVSSRAESVRQDGDLVTVEAQGQSVQGDMLLVAVGRAPNTDDLALDKAGVLTITQGIPVNEHLQTNVKHIYAAGDCTGGPQFSHYAGWQGWQAVRNALLLGSSRGFADLVPWCTFTDPEVAHVGLTEAQAREKHGKEVRVLFQDTRQVDRAVCENDKAGFLKIVHLVDGRLIGATVVAERAGEVINELAVALQRQLKLSDLAGTIHAYPTYSTDVQLLASQEAVRASFSSFGGKLIKTLSGIHEDDKKERP